MWPNIAIFARKSIDNLRPVIGFGLYEPAA
jgi:hypothetical protein